ncbi:hypothetical protein CIL05_03160 [Virgibacillus profundi]|uniref:Alcohol dehydrogenase-like C-terminal domain-containing protein n=1 Tax=Virgibacillus profundi TaxID=2024555 RepID=A0A2A2IHX3_9BACI|nr:hypothetical protein CIL05_03160 [Virgibacillus profundi]PXY54924.1 hypothetical protein CIT14_03235 [Virgibacillus profundi]
MEEDAVEKIMAVTGKGVEVAFESAGAQTAVTSALTALKKKGTLLVVAGFSQEVSIDPNAMLFKEANIQFSPAYANDFPSVIISIAEG